MKGNLHNNNNNNNNNIPWPTQPRIQWVLRIFPGGTAVGAWCWPLTST